MLYVLANLEKSCKLMTKGAWLVMSFIRRTVFKCIRRNLEQLVLISLELLTFIKMTPSMNYQDFFFVWTLISVFYILFKVKASFQLPDYDIFRNFFGGMLSEERRMMNLTSSFNNMPPIKVLTHYGSRALTISICGFNFVAFLLYI